MTTKEHLQKLPLQKRLQAMENIRRNVSGHSIGLSYRLDTISDARSLLMCLFVFEKTRQGYKYWYDIQQKYFTHE